MSSAQGDQQGERCVLYVTHTSKVSGAEHALLELLRGMPGNYPVRILAPAGELADLLRGEGFEVGHVPGTTASLRFSPLHTLRGAWQLLESAVVVRRTARRTNACLVHANSIRAGLIAVLASAWGLPVIVHVHDILPEGRITLLVRRLLHARASALIAVSHYGRRKFLFGLEPSARPFPVLYNPIDVERFSSSALTREDARRRLGTATEGPQLGIIAQITPWKGHDTAIAALARLRQSHPAARLICVGEAKFVGGRYDNLGFEERLRRQITEHGLDGAVEFWGQRDDIPAILAALDAILIPSWEEPLGRTMLEAMAAGTPVVATTVGGPAELVEPGISGFLAPPRDPEAWAAAVSQLLADPDRTAAMTTNARTVVAARFDRDRYVDHVLALYDQVLDAP